jgi:hypothetical protein
MRAFRNKFGSIAVLLCTCLWITDLDACWRARRRNHYSSYEVPCWADRSVKCPTGSTCWCCTSGGWVKCTSNCDACTGGERPSASCGAYDSRACDCSTKGLRLYYRMICDRTWHRLRFARPWESSNEWYPLRWLGAPCKPHAE